MQNSVWTFERMVFHYRSCQINSILDKVTQAESSKELDEVDRQHIEDMEKWIVTYRKSVGM